MWTQGSPLEYTAKQKAEYEAYLLRQRKKSESDASSSQGGHAPDSPGKGKRPTNAFSPPQAPIFLGHGMGVNMPVVLAMTTLSRSNILKARES